MRNKIIQLLFFGLITLGMSCSKESSMPKNDIQKHTAGTFENTKNDTKVYPILFADKSIDKKLAADFVWDQNGNHIRFSDYTKDKYVLLNFWGTWCPPCRGEIPDLISVSQELKDKGVVVIGIALERAESTLDAFNKVSAFWESKKMNYPVILGNSQIADEYGGINAVPTTFLINNKGKIVTTIEGPRSKDDFVAEIKRMMRN